MRSATLYGLTAEAYQAQRGFGPVADGLERAEWWLISTFAAGESEAQNALSILEGIDQLLAEEGPRGEGARFALATIGPEKLEAIRARAKEIIARAVWESAEASAITGGLLEDVEA